jgi:hypothetical protein
VIDFGRVEIDRLLDPAQAEHLREEVVVLLRVRSERCDVVQSVDLG